MKPALSTIGRYYADAARRLAFCQDAFLLLIRLYWGWQPAGASLGKPTNVAATARFFAELGIPLPTVNAVVSGTGELVGGLFLLAGLASRAAALVLVVNMTVALMTAHTGDAGAVLTEPARLMTSPPFTHLLISLIVLLFGPGLVSLDALVQRLLARRGQVQASTPPASEVETGISPRQLARSAAAAAGGLAVGAWVRGRAARSGRQGAAGGWTLVPGGDFELTPAAHEARRALDAEAPEGLQPSHLLLTKAHICCGLNTCQGKAKGGGNACFGQGGCALAKAHVCQGQNDCKGQGGCGEYPGQNTCEGKGGCAVPLKKDTWVKARKRFEELGAKVGAAVGKPPAGCPKG